MDIINTITKNPLHYVLYDIMCSNTPRKRPLIKNWGAAPIALVFIIIGAFVSNTMVGIVMIFMMIVPCGIPIINTNKWAWFVRQISFLTIGILIILCDYT